MQGAASSHLGMQGGVSSNNLKIKISDIPVILNKFNISYDKFTKKINKLINNGYTIEII